MNDLEHLKLTYRIALHYSQDPSTQLGAILLPIGNYGLYGANRFPPNITPTGIHIQRPNKYQYIEHAERNVIFAAARGGVITQGATLYCPWFACPDCARAIVLAGIKRVVGHKQMMDKTTDRWKQAIEIGNKILDAGGVIREYVDAKLFDDDFTVLFDERLWTP